MIYLSHTPPDIVYVVSIFSQYMHNPRKSHIDAVIRILQYLKSSPERRIMYIKHGHTKIDGYTDADRGESISDRKSTFRYFISQ